MKLKLLQIVNAWEALNRIGSEKLPIKMAYAIQRNIQKLKPELETYENARMGLIKEKYGTKGKDGNYRVEPSHMTKFLEELIELQAVEVEIDIHTVNLSEFNNDITPLDLMNLEWMFKDDMSEDKPLAQKKSKEPIRSPNGKALKEA